MTAANILSFGLDVTEAKINEILNISGKKYDKLIEAMKYSALAGGKRLRPAILLEFYRLCGGKYFNDAANFAAAIEFIHTYSLIHDDLPCMDNDDMRRGKPSCHIKFGEDTALLAGDALLTLAFYSAAQCKDISPKNVQTAISVLSDNAGVNGMVGGQVIDLSIENKPTDMGTITEMYSLKTGALICAAAQIGCILSGASDDLIDAALVFSKKIGLAFQIVDDILDLTATSNELGKPIGSDLKNNKSTYVSLVGLDKAKWDVDLLTEEAINALDIFGKKADGLRELALSLVNRNK